MFIDFEGVDYSGKTTLISELGKHISYLKVPKIMPEFRKRIMLVHKNPNHKERLEFFIKEIKIRSYYLKKSIKINQKF